MIRIIFLTLLFIFTLKAEIKNELFILPSQNSEIEDRILTLIENSNDEIIIAMYNFSYKKYAKELIKSAKKGIKITLILDGKKYKENKDFTNELKNNGIKIFIAKEKMHMKVAIFDNNTLIIGSSNWTKESFEENHESILITDDKEIIFKLSEYLKKEKL